MSSSILYIEDDLKIQSAVCEFLKTRGYNVFTASNGEDGINILANEKIDLLLLDLNLPDMTGEFICDFVMKNYNIPVIMISAKVDEDQVVYGFKVGASDYIKKPFSLKEMLARIELHLEKRDSEDNTLSFNNKRLVLNMDSHTLEAHGEEINLTNNEYKILSLFCNNPGKAFDRENIISAAFGFEYDGFERTIDSHIKNLRLKIEKDTKKPEFIQTVRGVGYKFAGKRDNNEK